MARSKFIELNWSPGWCPARGRGQRFADPAAHPKVFVEPTPIANALSFLRAVLESKGVALLTLSNEWPAFERLCSQLSLTGNAIPDAWIAAAAQTHHLHLVTFGKGFCKLLKPSMVTVLKA